MSDTLPDLRESEAIGPVAAIFADIRAIQRSNNVNYIWRHLATIPGALETAWERVKPLRSEIDAAGEAVWAQAEELVAVHGIACVECPAMPPAGHAVLASYAHGNSWNLAALTCLLTGLLPPVAGACVGKVLSQMPIPALPAFDELPERCRAAIVGLADAGPAASSGVRPSLWVHLGLWPDVLAALARDLPITLGSDAFRIAHGALLSYCGDAPHHPTELPAAAIVSLHRFRRRIAEMTLIGAMLADPATRRLPEPGAGLLS